mgnify:CR=1 FL=1
MNPLFNRTLKALHRNKLVKEENSQLYFQELGIKSILEYFCSLPHSSYSNVCFIGPYAHSFAKELSSGSFPSIEKLTVVDFSKDSLELSVSNINSVEVEGFNCCEESWNYPSKTFDLVISNLNMHWLNSLHSTVAKWKDSLKEQGVLIGCTMGEDTLQELRIALHLANVERKGEKLSSVNSMLSFSDVYSMLERLQFQKLTAEKDTHSLYFEDMFCLMSFLQSIGENNSSLNRKSDPSKEVFYAAASIYKELFTERFGEFKGKVPATFDVTKFMCCKS